MTNWLFNLTGDTQVQLLGLLRRSHQTITGLAKALRLTDNAVRTHVAVLRRDGIVEDVGVERNTGGKPARLYGLTRAGEELFPKAYAVVLGRLVAEITRASGRERALELLRAVGVGLGAGTVKGGGAEAATAALRSIGADVELARTENGWRIQGYGCPLSAVTPAHPEVCELARALVAEIAGAPVTECCERGSERPRCAFLIAS
ncbi:MAG TPA: ArsR family transcriptional regulator [Gemmatimonadales bacterium]|jgi:predicted ArsR family transcriptional regulator|nr:ArsR family transcriptional regulator [Gemmatimonadales bacterium]